MFGPIIILFGESALEYIARSSRISGLADKAERIAANLQPIADKLKAEGTSPAGAKTATPKENRT